MKNKIYIILGILLGKIYSMAILPKKEEGPTKINLTLNPIFYKGMLIIKINKENALHIHHWIFSIIIVIFLWKINKKKKYHYLLKGFFIYLFLQGLSYKDRFEILCKNPYK